MKPATQLILTLSAIATFTAAPAAIVWAIDPLHIFRPKSNTLENLHHLPRHQNAGLIRSYLSRADFGFDTIVMGTSLSQNFSPLQVQHALNTGRVLKMAMSGAMPHTQVSVMSRALQETTLKRVIWEINDRTFAWKPVDTINTNHTFPHYLYGHWSDLYQYIFNIDNLKTAAESIGLRQAPTGWWTRQGDEWGSWHRGEDHWHKFREKHWNKHFDAYRAAVAKQVFEPYPTIGAMCDEYPRPELYQGVDLVAELVRLNPDVVFDFFIPPISTAFYAHKDPEEFVLRFGLTRYAVEQISPLSNARVFAFNDVKDIVMDLSLYRDLAHYHPSINAWIAETIASGEHMLTTKTIDEYEATWFSLVRSFEVSDLDNPQ